VCVCVCACVCCVLKLGPQGSQNATHNMPIFGTIITGSDEFAGSQLFDVLQ